MDGLNCPSILFIGGNMQVKMLETVATYNELFQKSKVYQVSDAFGQELISLNRAIPDESVQLEAITSTMKMDKAVSTKTNKIKNKKSISV